NAILGLDFMIFSAWKMDYGARLMSLFDGTVIISFATKFKESQVAYVSKLEKIQPFTEAMLRVSLRRPWRGRQIGLVQPIEGQELLKDSLMVGHAVIKPWERTVFVKICNPTPNAVTLYKNTKFAEVIELQED